MRVRLIGIMTKRELAIESRFFIDYDVIHSIEVKDIIDKDLVKVEINFTCNQGVKSFEVNPYDNKTEVDVKMKTYGLGFLFKELIHSKIE